jgi:hypothetical protein
MPRFENPNDLRVFGWIKQLVKGDVIVSRNGNLRVIRRVTHHGPSIPKTYITLAIKHCSWTGRAYTVYNGNDLRQMGYRPIKANFALRSRVDRLMEEEFDRPGKERPVLTCCDGMCLP